MKTWAQALEPDIIFGISGWLPRLIDELCAGYQTRYIDLDLYPEKFPGKVSGIDQNSQQIGAICVEEVYALWGRQEYGVPKEAKTILLPGKLVDSM